MFVLALLICTLPLIQGKVASAETPVTEIISRAESYYEKRDNPENLRLAIETLKEAKAQLTEKADKKWEARVCVMLARCYFKLADYHTTAKKEKESLYKYGQDYASQAIELDPDNPGGHYWLAVNIAKWGALHPFKFVGSDERDIFEETIQEALKRDPAYDFGGPHRTLAAYHMPQRLLFIKIWGNKEKALAHARAAMDVSKNYIWNHLVLARVLWQSGNKAEAVEKLKQTAGLSEQALPEAVFENRYAMNKARKYLEEYSRSGNIHW